MEAADVIREEGTEVMPIATPDFPETRGVEAMRTDRGRPSRSAGSVARKATGKVSAGKSGPIRREPEPEMVPDMPTRETGSARTTPKTPEEPETRSKLHEANHPEIGRGVVRRLRRVKPYDEP